MRELFVFLLLIYGGVIFGADIGQEAYVSALQVKTLYERKGDLNQSLKELLEAHPSAATFQNTANAFALLGEPAWGIYYLYRALKLEPRNAAIESQLDQLINAAQLPPRVKENPFGPLIRWHQILSTGEKFILLLLCLVILFLIASLWIWRPIRLLMPLIITLGAVATLLSGSLLYGRYGAPLEGVLVKAAALYREPDAKAHLVQDNPLPAGLKLEVLEEKEEGQWLKVKTSAGEYGYVSYKAIRLID